MIKPNTEMMGEFIICVYIYQLTLNGKPMSMSNTDHKIGCMLVLNHHRRCCCCLDVWQNGQQACQKLVLIGTMTGEFEMEEKQRGWKLGAQGIHSQFMATIFFIKVFISSSFSDTKGITISLISVCLRLHASVYDFFFFSSQKYPTGRMHADIERCI